MYDQAGQPDPESAYLNLAPRLERIVSRNVTAPAGVIEDACQVAWSRWLLRRDEVASGALLAWLATTATREALRMLRTKRREVSLDAAMSAGAEVIELPTRAPGPDDLAQLHERLAEVRRLPVRQQQMVWLVGLGFDYAEIGVCTGDTHRTVERQLHRARHRLREST